MADFDVIVIGGGLAGLTAALKLSKSGLQVMVIEKNEYPKHKVCGEYVSNEVCPFLSELGIDFGFEYPEIKRFKLATVQGKSIEAKLPLGGFGISRYAFDNILYLKCLETGVTFCFEKVQSVVFKSKWFKVATQNETYDASYVMGCFGKRSNIDKELNRKFSQKKSPWLGIKAHYHHQDFPEDLVALGTFTGGYGGLSRVEDGKVNFCYLVHYSSFQKFGNIDDFNAQIVHKNPFLNAFLSTATRTDNFKKPISISQVSFEKKQAVENHMLMCGDSAGLIHPLCGNGMAMAIMAAKLAAESILKGVELGWNRNLIERTYSNSWQKEFSRRLWFGRRLQHLFLNPKLLGLATPLLQKNQKVLKTVIAKTHGNPQYT